MLHRLAPLLFAVALAPQTVHAGPKAIMDWDRTPLAPGAAVAGYDVLPDGKVVASACRDDGACSLVILPEASGQAPVRHAPPVGESWRIPRAIDARRIAFVSIPADGRVWSADRTAIKILDLGTGQVRTVTTAGSVGSLTKTPGGELCLSEATGAVDLPLIPGPQLKPVRYAIACVALDGGGRRRLGEMVFNGVDQLVALPDGRLAFNAYASTYGGRTVPFATASGGDPVRSAAALADPRTGEVTAAAEPRAGEFVWLAGMDGDGVLLLRRGPMTYPGLRGPERRFVVSRLTASGETPLTTVAYRPPGEIRARPGDSRGLALLHDGDGPGFAWIDLATGAVTPATALTQGVIASIRDSR